MYLLGNGRNYCFKDKQMMILAIELQHKFDFASFARPWITYVGKIVTYFAKIDKQTPHLKIYLLEI